MRRSLIGLSVLLALAGCPPAAILPSGCGKDVDCKGTRICVERMCVWPAPGRRGATVGRASMGLDGGVRRGDGGLASADGGVADMSPAPADALAPLRLPERVPSPLGPAPMFHLDPQHSGRSFFRAPTARPHEVMRLMTDSAIYSSPTIAADGTVLVGSHDRTIYATGADGKVRWRFTTGDMVWCSPALGPGGVVYVGSDDDHLYALDLATGKLRWSMQAGPCRASVGVGPEASRCDVDAVTVGPDGTVYASADGLYAVKPDGALRWKFSPGSTHCASAAALGADGTVYVGCQDDALYAVDASGLQRWSYRAGDDIDSSPAVAPDGTIYFGSDDHKLYALSPAGALKFAVVTGGPVHSSPALAADGTVYVGSLDGSLYAIRPSGDVAWIFRTADRVLASPTVDAAGRILIGSEDDRLYELEPDGRLSWSLLLGGDIDSTCAIGADGTIYVGSDDRALHGLR